MNSIVGLFSGKLFVCSNINPLRFRHALRRRPIKVLTNFEEKRSPVLPKVDFESDLVKRKREFIKPKGGIEIPIPPYVKLKDTDERYANVFLSMKSVRPGETQNKILLEGVRLINDALKAGVKLESLFFSKEETLSKIRLKKPEDINLYKVLYRTLQLWSSLETSPGIIGVFKKPTLDELKVKSDPIIPVTILAYNIKSHRVMGSIIRNAASAGCKSILFTKGCVNIWSQKVMRAASGAHFHIPVIDYVDWLHVLNYVPSDSTIYLLDSRSEAADYVYDDILESTEQNKDSDSEESEEDDSEFSEDDIENVNNIAYVTLKEGGGQVIVDEAYGDTEHLSNYEPGLLKTVNYSDVSYPSKNIFVCVSDHNFCEDPRAMKLCCDFGGKWLNIPTENALFNVSSSLALPVVLYEIKRQLGEVYVIK